MDNSSNSSFQFRISSQLLQKFKLACGNLNVKPSSVLRNLVQDFINSSDEHSVAVSRSFSDDEKEQALKRRFTIGEMYSGPGGLGLAARNARIELESEVYGFKHAWATDYDADSCMTYQKNVLWDEPDAQMICDEIANIKLNELPKVDGFLYGFPCNDFSNVGETRGLTGKFGPLYSYGIEYINYANPKFIFAENVSGLSNANEGYAFKKIMSELSGAGQFGYNLKAHLYKFEEYGIPQARHRYIIVGLRKDLGLDFRIPKPGMIRRNSRDALEIPPIPINAPNQEYTKQSQKVIERLNSIQPGQNAWTADLPEHLRLNVRGARLSMIYKRLDPEKPSYTVTGSGGGGTHVYHWNEPRALTNRERARLQTFPDDFHFFGSKESVRKQIGMAVPVAGAQIILEAILMTLANENYAYVEPNMQFDP